MLTTFRAEPALRPVFLADAAANAAWAVMLAVLTALGLVVGRKAGADAMLLGAAVSVNYASALFSGWLPLLCRRWPLGGVMMALRLLASLSLLPMLVAPSLPTLMIGYAGVLLLGGISDAAYPALLNVVYPNAAHTRVMSLIFTVRALAAFLFTMLIGWLLTGRPLDVAIRALGGLCVFGFLAVAAMWRFR
ncbi:MAG TPA: hypothetical protein PLZ36_08860, partial [Armatimonadota bacterium]|nr:hypothetical protein [Armatimonadota bacterium]